MGKYYSVTTTRNDASKAILKIEGVLAGEQLLDEAVLIQMARIRKRFLSAVDTDGKPWPVSNAAKKRESTGRGGATLFDTGRLFHSIQSIKRSTTTRAIYTDVPYAAKHQLGTHGMVKREFLSASSDDVKLIAQFIKSKLDEVA